MMATKLSNALVAPAKVANILDWRKSVGVVMGLDITRERIGVAVSEHPEQRYEHKSIPLHSMSLHQEKEGVQGKKSQVNIDLISELEAVVRQHRVCAFVVNWPVHEGRMGEQCGKVLQVLDSIMDQSNCVVTRKRPFTLWCNDKNASLAQLPPDEWGRAPVFARSPEYSPGMKFSSKTVIREESSANSSVEAANVLDEWVKNHWEIDNRMGLATAPKKTKSDTFFFSTHSVDEYNSDNACLQAALL